MWATILAGRIWRGELINRRKDGSLYDAAVTISPVKDAFGNLVSFVGVQHDISALKELDRMKSQFVSDVSHELRTPLTNIRLYLDLLQGTGDPAKTTRYLETMDRESGRLADLIDDLLSLSRLDAGTVAFFPSPTNLNDLLLALVEDRRALAASRGLTLALECETGVPRVMGDGRLLTQVFTNLLTNALNYTESGGKVMLRTRLHVEDGARWVVAEVEDTGLGVPLDEQPLIFRRFFRGQASRQTKAAGTGLGLAICKEIVDRHAGRLQVQSDGVAGGGSRFTVWLPAAEE
jgi:signal transduction histidine kinase